MFQVFLEIRLVLILKGGRQMGDKVLHPEDKQRSAPIGEKQVKSSIIEGPTQTMDNLTPYNRSSKKK